MTPAELRRLAGEATGTLEHVSGEGVFVASEADARLIALAPDLALWAADAAEALQPFASRSCVHFSFGEGGRGKPRDETECRYCRVRALLARFSEINERSGA